MENAVIEKPVHHSGASNNPSPSLPEDLVRMQPSASLPHARSAERTRVQGAVSMSLAGGFPQIGKLQDASMNSLSALVEIQIPIGKIYNLQVKAFRNGRNYEFIAPAVCVHSTLNGRGFKVGFKFGPMSEVTTTTINAMLAFNN